LIQTGTVTRHGRGWRGLWREDGKRCVTARYKTKGEAREALNRELDRIRLGTAYRAPITLRELTERFLAQYQAHRYPAAVLPKSASREGHAGVTAVTTVPGTSLSVSTSS
jgi:hypothetical protein